MTDIYQAPGADLSPQQSNFQGGGSLQGGIDGNFKLDIGTILSEAWERTNGSKGTVWLAVLFYLIAVMLLSFVMGIITSILGFGGAGVAGSEGAIGAMIAGAVVSQVIQMFITLPLTAGFFMLGIKLSVRAPVQPTEIFKYFSKTLRLVGTTILVYLMVMLGMLLLVLPGIYLAVAYAMAIPLVVEKDLSPWQAMEASRKAITHQWFQVFGLYIVVGLIMIVAMIPLGIGLIWVIPMMILVGGIVYRTVFGYSGMDAARA